MLYAKECGAGEGSFRAMTLTERRANGCVNPRAATLLLLDRLRQNLHATSVPLTNDVLKWFEPCLLQFTI